MELRRPTQGLPVEDARAAGGNAFRPVSKGAGIEDQKRGALAEHSRLEDRDLVGHAMCPSTYCDHPLFLRDNVRSSSVEEYESCVSVAYFFSPSFYLYFRSCRRPTFSRSSLMTRFRLKRRSVSNERSIAHRNKNM